VHIISRKIFKDAAINYPNDAASLYRTYKTLKGGVFESPERLKAVFPSLDNFKYKDKWWVIDIGGNNLRLIMSVEFSGTTKGYVYAKHIVTHTEYDKLCDKYRKGF